MAADALAALAALTARDGWPPTVRELAAELGTTAGRTLAALQALEALGHVERQAGRSRAVRVTAAGRAALEGKAAADAAA